MISLFVSPSLQFQGEEAIGISFAGKSTAILSDWRRACEKVYKYITHAVSTKGFGNGVSVVLSDYRCNQHVTSCGCFERAVRLPAALRAARDMGAGHNENIPLLTTIEKCYVDAAENDVLLKAHSISYLRRMKSRCSQIRDNQVAYLTEDSDGNGGEDTSKDIQILLVASFRIDFSCLHFFLDQRAPVGLGRLPSLA